MAVEGRLQVRKFADNDGNNRWSTEVVASHVGFLAKPKNGGGDDNQDSHNDSPIGEDDLPF